MLLVLQCLLQNLGEFSKIALREELTKNGHHVPNTLVSHVPVQTSPLRSRFTHLLEPEIDNRLIAARYAEG